MQKVTQNKQKKKAIAFVPYVGSQKKNALTRFAFGAAPFERASERFDM